MDLRNRFVTKLYYLCNCLYYSKLRAFALPLCLLYRFIVYWIMGTDLHYKTKVGKGLIIYHGQSLVVNPRAILGDNVVLRHGVTIGNFEKNNRVSGCPILGNNVKIGCGAVLLGEIKIGDNVEIYANAIVTKNVPPNSVCYGYNIVRSINEC